MRTTSPIAALFGKSPIRPLQRHMHVVERCASLVEPVFRALDRRDWEEVESLKAQIFDLEQEADDIKNEIRSRLPRGLFMAFDRRDLLDLLSSQDSIADTAQDIAGLLLLRRMEIPRPLSEGLFAYLDKTHAAVHQCAAVIDELDELVEVGFRGRAGERVIEMVGELGSLETESDELGMSLTRTLFEHEASLEPVSVFFWYQLIEDIGDMADFAEDVGDRLRLLIAT